LDVIQKNEPRPNNKYSSFFDLSFQLPIGAENVSFQIVYIFTWFMETIITKNKEKLCLIYVLN